MRLPRLPRTTIFAGLAVTLAFAALPGCGTLSPPFDKMKDSQMTVYRLQNVEPPQAAAAQAAPATSGGFQLPAQVQQWIQAGASLLPPGLVPPGLLPGAAPLAAPAAPDAPRFHGFRIVEWQPVSDASVKSDIVDAFGHANNFQSATSNCMFAEFGFAIAQPTVSPTPADILVSLSCEQTQAFNFNWPYGQTGITPDATKKIVSIAQRVFQGH
jgi:hypothetical protein